MLLTVKQIVVLANNFYYAQFYLNWSTNEESRQLRFSIINMTFMLKYCNSQDYQGRRQKAPKLNRFCLCCVYSVLKILKGDFV